ncbi:MAG TPA: CHAD domain-containing protein, partial [Plasticicumulans sp.]
MSDPARSAVKAEAVRLDPSSDARGALAVITAAAARQIAANRSLLVDGYDAEAVHQLRVGARRLRAALKLFGRYEPAVRRPPFLPALRTLVAAAG